MNDPELPQNEAFIKVKFVSCIRQVDQVTKELLRHFTRHGGREDLFALELVIRETLVNAVVHGNRSDRSKAVSCSLCVLADMFRFTVKDEGAGFDWRGQLSRTTIDEDSTSGRGLFLAKSYGYDLSFNEAGNEICLSRSFPDKSN